MSIISSTGLFSTHSGPLGNLGAKATPDARLRTMPEGEKTPMERAKAEADLYSATCNALVHQMCKGTEIVGFSNKIEGILDIMLPSLTADRKPEQPKDLQVAQAPQGRGR